MKRNVVFVLLIGFMVILYGCSTDTESHNTDESKSVELISPKGKVLTESVETLKRAYLNKVGLGKEKNFSDVVIGDIRYTENELYSAAYIDVLHKEKSSQMLIIFGEEKELTYFVDDNNVRIIQTPTNNLNVIKDASVVEFRKNPTDDFDVFLKSVFVCNGGCCTWSRPAQNHHHCGCGSAPPPASIEPIIFTTSDECQIQYIP